MSTAKAPAAPSRRICEKSLIGMTSLPNKTIAYLNLEKNTIKKYYFIWIWSLIDQFKY